MTPTKTLRPPPSYILNVRSLTIPVACIKLNSIFTDTFIISYTYSTAKDNNFNSKK